MSDVTTDEWSSLRAYVDARAEDHHKLHISEHHARASAAEAVDTRLEGMNEFRAAITDANRSYLSRDTIEVMMSGLDHRIEAVRSEAQRSAIAAGIAAGILGIIGGVIIANVVP